MLYDEARMALTKERLEDLRKEKKMSCEQPVPKDMLPSELLLQDFPGIWKGGCL